MYDANPAYLSTFSTAGQLDATLDFGFQDAGTGFAKGGATTRLRDFFAGDDWYTDADSNAYASPTFLGNHDMGRIGTFLKGTDSVLERDRLAHSLMYLTRGQPVVYYGDEQGFVGDGGDKDAREDMFPSRVASYNDNDLIGTDATTADANYDTAHPLYRTIRDLARLRRTYPALADGAQLHRYASNNAGVYAFSRIDAGERREFLVALNNATTAKTVTVGTEMPRGRFARVWPAGGATLRTDEEARTDDHRAAAVGGRVACRRAGSRGRGAAPAIHLEKPSAGGVVGGRSPITVGVPDGGFNQVTVAWRPVGATQWTALGTDDNAPYRVFHDVSAMPKGTPAGVPRGAARQQRQPVGRVVVRHGRRPGARADPRRRRWRRAGRRSPGPCRCRAATTARSAARATGSPTAPRRRCRSTPTTSCGRRRSRCPRAATSTRPRSTATLGRELRRRRRARRRQHPARPRRAARDVTFYYDHASHWITTDAEGPIATLAGSFQSELGCPADWSPGCMRSWLKDLDGDGTYTFTATLPAGSYETKVAHGLSWDENYGQDGARDGANIPFDVPAGGVEVLFTYDVTTHRLQVSTRAAGASPDLGQGQGAVAAPRPRRVGRPRPGVAPLPPALVHRR